MRGTKEKRDRKQRTGSARKPDGKLSQLNRSAEELRARDLEALARMKELEAERREAGRLRVVRARPGQSWSDRLNPGRLRGKDSGEIEAVTAELYGGDE